MNELEFHSKVAIVAGGSLGIGKAAARRLASGGASVLICGRREDAVMTAVAEFQSDGLIVEIPLTSAFRLMPSMLFQ